MSRSLIPPDSSFLLWAAMFALVAAGLWAQTTRIGRTLSGVVVVLTLALVLGNVGVLPRSSPAYDQVWTYFVPAAIPLLLLKADLRRIVPETGGLFLAFVVGALGTIMGTLLGLTLLPLGEFEAELAGIFSATYIGGSMNMAAVAEAVRIDQSLLMASVAADNVMGTFYLLTIAALPALAWVRRWLPSRVIGRSVHVEPDIAADTQTAFKLLHVSAAVGLALAICACGKLLAGWLGTESFSILYITAISVAVANLFPGAMKRLEGDYETGMLLMYLFFVTIGASADVAMMIDSALVIVAFAGVILIVHLVTVLLLGHLLRIDLAELVIASVACAAGPAPAAALAAGRRWQTLISPAVMLGVFGYVIANFIGVALWTLYGGGG